MTIQDAHDEANAHTLEQRYGWAKNIVEAHERLCGATIALRAWPKNSSVSMAVSEAYETVTNELRSERVQSALFLCSIEEGTIQREWPSWVTRDVLRIGLIRSVGKENISHIDRWLDSLRNIND